MKKTTKIGFAIVLACLATTGCQKENILESPEAIHQNTSVQTVTYTIDGVTRQMTLRGNDALREFINQLLSMAKMGHQVTFYINECVSTETASKETVTYSTSNKTEAEEWCEMMAGQGYTVSFKYDSKLDMYVCTAIR